MKTLMLAPELLELDLSSKTYIVTGANSGAGLETARQLVKQGAHVIGACRRVDAGETEFASFAGLAGTSEVMRLDLASLESVREFAAAFANRHQRLDALINNAGAVFNKGVTADGFEETFAVNYLGPFLLTHLLLPILISSAPARIVNVSSVAHAGMRTSAPSLHFADLDFRTREFKSSAAYSEAKLALVMFSSELARRLDGTRVTCYSVHPGWIESNFGSAVMPGWFHKTMQTVLRPFRGPLGIQIPWEGAQTQLHCALAESALQHNGAYFSQNSILYSDRKDRAGGWPMTSPNPQAHDQQLSRRLYETTCELVGIEGVSVDT